MFEPLKQIDPRLVAYAVVACVGAFLVFWLWQRYRRFMVRRAHPCHGQFGGL